MGGCGSCDGQCNCALANGSNTTVSGTGVVGDPYTVDATVVTESTNTASLSGNGTAASPLRPGVSVSGRANNALVVRAPGDGDPGLFVEVPIRELRGPDGVAYSPDGVGGVDVTAASVRAGLATSLPWATLDEPNQRWNFTPAIGSGYVWATVAGVVGWYDLDTVLDTLALAVGEGTFDRAWGLASEAQVSLDTVHLTAFTAKRSEACTSVTVWTGSQQATGASNVWVGVYSVGGTWTRVATSADVVGSALLNTETSYAVSLGAGFTKVAGAQYAVAVLQRGGTGAKLAGPAMRNLTATSYKGHFATDGPVLYANIAGTTLPASIDPANLTTTGNMVPLYAWMKP